MKVKDLPQWLQDLAWQRCKEYVSKLGADINDYTEEDTLGCMFLFNKTPEGYTFWANICYKNIIPENPELLK